MFVARADVLLDLLHQAHPDLERTLRAIAEDWEDPDQQETIGHRWAAIEPIAIDHAVAEPAAASGRVACVPADLAWSDIGDWASLADLMEPPSPGSPRVLGSAAMVQATDSSGLVVPAGGRRVVVLGLDDVVVVDTPDAVLVVPAARAQEVKGVVAELDATGATELL
jgi:mannose-1-phosphate guanylyltransferase